MGLQYKSKDVSDLNPDLGHKEKHLNGSESSGTGSSILEREDENKERGNWSRQLDFLLSCVGYAVGLGNIWRFPYLCYRNGGGAFLIPYLICLLVCGIPMFFLEVAYGQFASLSPISVWRISPMFKGIGYGMVLVSAIVCIYYNVIIAWSVYYFFKSLATTLPWSTCNNHWNTPACTIRTRNNSFLFNESLPDKSSSFNFTDAMNGTIYNTTIGSNDTVLNFTKRTTPSEEFWHNHVLRLSDGIHDMGGVRWELFGTLLFAWVVVFVCLSRGIKSSGKVVYVTATFPYLVLLILLVRGVTLPGAMEGIKFYIIPKWEKLLKFQVWGDAAMQIFYSTGMAWGALITMASYNKFHNNCYRDSLIIPVINSCTSIFAGFVIFSIIGFMAYETGSEVEKVVTQGPGLLFVVYPAAIARLPIAPLWAVLFFLMVFCVGLDTQFGTFETLTSAIFDEAPKFVKGKKVWIIGALCFVEFLLGIPCILEGGIYYLQIMDWYSSTFALMVISFTEAIVISWVYGMDQFYCDIALMIGYKPCMLWKILWSFVTPLVIVLIFLFSIIQHTPVYYGDYVYPSWAITLGWTMASLSMIPLPFFMLKGVFLKKGTIIERIKALMRPTPEWGPALDKYREQYVAGLSNDSGHQQCYAVTDGSGATLMMHETA